MAQGDMTYPDGGSAVNFHEMLEQILARVQRQGRVSYPALKQQFDLDDAYLEDLKEEIIYAKARPCGWLRHCPQR